MDLHNFYRFACTTDAHKNGILVTLFLLKFRWIKVSRVHAQECLEYFSFLIFMTSGLPRKLNIPSSSSSSNHFDHANAALMLFHCRQQWRINSRRISHYKHISIAFHLCWSFGGGDNNYINPWIWRFDRIF